MANLKTNHPFSLKQVKSLNEELQKISNTTIGLKGIKIPGKNNIQDIEISRSSYVLDVFLTFTDMSVPEYPKFECYGIATSGKVNKAIKQTMEFQNLSDRVHFFNNLQPIEFSR
jgi:hypothetical protein